MQETPRGFFVDIPSKPETEDVAVAPKKSLTKKQRMLRAKNKLAKASRKKNRG